MSKYEYDERGEKNVYLSYCCGWQIEFGIVCTLHNKLTVGFCLSFYTCCRLYSTETTQMKSLPDCPGVNCHMKLYIHPLVTKYNALQFGYIVFDEYFVPSKRKQFYQGPTQSGYYLIVTWAKDLSP